MKSKVRDSGSLIFNDLGKAIVKSFPREYQGALARLHAEPGALPVGQTGNPA